MAHHEVDVLLGIGVHRPSFWDDAADELMVVLTGPFLLAHVGIAIEYLCENFSGRPVHLDRDGIGKFGSVVRQDDREDSGEVIMSKLQLQLVKYLDDRCGGVALTDECEHEVAVYDVYREQHLFINALLTNDAVHLHDRRVRVLFSEQDVVSIGPSNPAGLVLLQRLHCSLPAGLVTHLAGQVEVADAIEHAGIDVCC